MSTPPRKWVVILNFLVDAPDPGAAAQEVMAAIGPTIINQYLGIVDDVHEAGPGEEGDLE